MAETVLNTTTKIDPEIIIGAYPFSYVQIIVKE